MTHDFCGLKIAAEGEKAHAFLFEESGARLGVTDVRTAGADVEEQDVTLQIGSGASRALKTMQTDFGASRAEIVQEGGGLRVRTVFEKRGGGAGVYSEVTNLSEDPVTLENAAAVVFSAIDASCGRDELFLYRFYNSHHAECQPRRVSLDDLGLFGTGHRTYRRVIGINAGSWTSKAELPQIILENAAAGRFAMLQIESCGAWYWEIGEDADARLYLTLSGGNFQHTAWKKVLQKGESYKTPRVGVCAAGSLNGVLAAMTEYRRAIKRDFPADENLPAVFNEYMHLSWDSPEEARTRALAPVAKRAGADIYVIDCGWHDEVPGNVIYGYVGNWKESAARFPHGVRAITDYIRACGMKAGLWIEPEVAGKLSGVKYPEEAYIRRNGARVCASGRYFLDFRHPAVKEAMSAAISRMVKEYGADYIKIDCNQDSGAGTEINSLSAGDGLEKTSAAFFEWLKGERKKYPHVIFESCASGGQRMDWKSLSESTVVSTSDQVDYKKYPFIAANILAAVLPEQAGVWSYPYVPSPSEGAAGVNADSTVSNMVNGILGRLHLASDLSKLDETCFALVREGVEYGKSLAPFKKKAVPYLPLGFTKFGAKTVAAGLTDGEKLVLAVWDTGRLGEAKIPLPQGAQSVSVGYPKGKYAPECSLSGNFLQVKFLETHAAAVEIALSCAKGKGGSAK